MTDLYRGHDLTTIVESVARSLRPGLTDDGWNGLSLVVKQAYKSSVTPIVTATIDAIEDARKQRLDYLEMRTPAPMRLYDYVYSTDPAKENPDHYENQTHQHDLYTCTVWTVHMALRPEHLEKVLRDVSGMGLVGEGPDLEIATGEYTYGDSFTEWCEPTDDDDDRHLAIYFKAADMDKARHLGSYFAQVVKASIGGTDQRIAETGVLHHVSTSGDYAEQIPG